MEIKKVNLDREKLTSSYIEQKQDFTGVLNEARLTKTPTWKSPWFYGAVGLSSVAITAICLTDFNNQNELDVKTSTKQKINYSAAIVSSKPVVAIASMETKTNQEAEKKNKSEKSFKKNTEVIKKTSVTDANVNDVSTPEPEMESVKIYRSELPAINGVTSGKLSANSLINATEIEISEDYKIVSYKVQYFNGRSDLSVQISGNIIPENIKKEIIAYNIGQMVFFTDIKGLTKEGKMMNLSSMNFKIMPN
jgi:hypothetical protein